MVFKVGQKVVYPTQGVAVIEQIQPRPVNGEQLEFYLLRLLADNSVVLVPTRNADQIGLRPPIPPKLCNKIFEVLSEDFSDPPNDWKDRFKGFSDAIRSGDLFEVAKVLKTLTYLNKLKPLSFREKQMLERVRFLIVSELALVSKKSQDSITPIIEEALVGACFKHNSFREATIGNRQ